MCLSVSCLQHRLGKIGGHDESAKSLVVREHGAYVHRAGAEIQVPATRIPRNSELGDRLASPYSVDVETEQVIQEIVPRRDFRKNLLHVCALFRSAFRGAQCRESISGSRHHFSKLSGTGLRGKLT